MATSKITHIICYDDHRNYTENVRKRFADSSKYLVTSFHNKDQFIGHCEKLANIDLCIVAIIGFTESVEKIDMLNEFIGRVKETLPGRGIILLVQPINLQEIKGALNQKVDALIPINNNMVLRIHNVVKRFISEFNIIIFKRRRNRAFIAVALFIALMLAAFLFFFFRYPMYF
ncbi:MAG: hypothetical protein ACOX5K_00395 [Bacteroidales bacterium]|jgi:hypothetical protein